jgi:cysteinyl-tRNA synthetase
MEEKKAAFDRAVFDDLNMPEAMAVLFGALKDADFSPAERKALALDFDGVLGLRLEEAARKEEALPESVGALVAARDEARRAKNWAESDRLRGELQKLGYKVDDTPKGTKVSRT